MKQDIPHNRAEVLDGSNRFTRDWYDYFRRIKPVSAPTSVQQTVINNSQYLPPIAGSTAGYDEGTSFPVGPVSGDKFYRTDLNWLCFYDGTRWLTCHEYCVNFNRTGDHPTGSGGVLLAFRASMPSDYVAYFTNAYISVEAGSSPHNGSNYTTLSLYTLGSTNTTSVTLATQLTNGGITASTTAKYDISINTSCPITDTRLILTATHTGTITNAYVYPMVNYRLIVT